MNPENRADLIKTLKRIISKDKEEFSGVDLTNLVNKKLIILKLFLMKKLLLKIEKLFLEKYLLEQAELWKMELD